MKNTLPSLTVLIGLCCAATVTSAAEPVSNEGQDLIRQAAEQMARHASLEARIRQRVNLFGRQLSGYGTYQQAWIDNTLRLRMEMKLPVGDRTTSLQQINDGDYLWIRRDILDQQRLSVVDLRKVRAAWEKQATRGDSALVVGGLSQLLFGLHERFEFSTPREATLGNEPVWIVEGTWRAEPAGGTPKQAEKKDPAEAAPSFLPAGAVAVLSRDELLPLFPFRVEYYRNATDQAGQKKREVLLSIEFFEVRAGDDVDPRYFTYTAGDQEIVDETDAFLAREQGGP
jgi:hypothetical protein